MLERKEYLLTTIKFADDEIEEKKITPLSDEYVTLTLEPIWEILITNLAEISKSSKHMAQLPMQQR